MRTFVFTDNKSHKFWNIDLQGTRFTVTFGKVGTKGQTQLKEFADEPRAKRPTISSLPRRSARATSRTTPGAAAPGPGLPCRALEAGILAEPDDRASHSAYADYLSEQGDPLLAARGEFISVQLRGWRTRHCPQRGAQKA